MENNDELKSLLEENLKMTKEIYEVAKKVKHFMFWQRVYGLLRILIIVVPIILAIIYLPPILSGVFKQYSELMDLNGVKNQLNIDQIKALIPGTK